MNFCSSKFSIITFKEEWDTSVPRMKIKQSTLSPLPEHAMYSMSTRLMDSKPVMRVMCHEVNFSQKNFTLSRTIQHILKVFDIYTCPVF